MDKEVLLLSWIFSIVFLCFAGVLLHQGKHVTATVLVFVDVMLLSFSGELFKKLPDEWFPDLPCVILLITGILIVLLTMKGMRYRLYTDGDDPERIREETLRRLLERAGCTLFSVQWKTIGTRYSGTWALPSGSAVMITYTQPGTSIDVSAVRYSNRKAAKLLNGLVRYRCFANITTFILMPQVIATDKNGMKGCCRWRRWCL